jgi:hypothetical protein
MRKKKSKNDAHADLPRSEREAILYEPQLNKYITKHNGQFIRDDDRSFHMILDNARIPLAYDRENCDQAKLMLDACGVSSLSQGAQAAIQRLRVSALTKASSLAIRQFAALSVDHSRLYIPVQGGKPLKITIESIEPVTNGDNEDKFWVEHPHVSGGMPGFKYQPEYRTAEGLRRFEKLLVETQSCRVSAMRWLVAMHEGFFPFVRDYCRPRFILVHIGGTQQGKTSAAQRFTQLLGLGEVEGDYTAAALANQPDVGLLVMDNKEQANFTQPLIDFCLYLSTGAKRGRSTTDGKLRPQATSRPVGVITSIEGVPRDELQSRCVEVVYEINGTKVDRDEVEDEILKRRSEILSAMVPVFQEWLRLRGTKRFWTVCPLPNFERHLVTLAELLCAFAKIAGKHDAWAEQIIHEWERQLSQSGADTEAENDLEFPIKHALKQVCIAPPADNSVSFEKITFEGKLGTLFLTEAGTLLVILKRYFPRDLALPQNANGLGRRLRSARFRELKFLDNDPNPPLPQLKRTANKRPIGFFMADDSGGDTDSNDGQ